MDMSFKIIRPYKLAEMMGVHRATIHRMELRGDLPPRKQFSKRIIGWKETDILEWMEGKDVNMSVQEAVK